MRNQLHLMAPGEYAPVVISVRLLPSGKVIEPVLAESGRRQHVELPNHPSPGRAR